MATAFVTGASSLLGNHVLEALLADGWRVVALLRPGRGGSGSDSRVQWVSADITAWKNLRAVVPPAVDVVIHAAHNHSLWQGDAEAQTRLNVFGTRHMVRAALECRARRFVHTSSIMAYGLHSGTITEQTPPRAARSRINLIRSLAHAEREVRRGVRQGLDAIILNPAHILGPDARIAWGRIMQLIRQRRIVAAPAGGGSFCHVRAVAHAHVQAAKRGQSGSNYLLGGVDITYVKLLRLLGERLRRPTLPWPAPTGLLRGYARIEEIALPLLRLKPDITRDMIEILSAHTYCKSRKAIEELEYQPLSLDEMLQDCMAWAGAQH